MKEIILITVLFLGSLFFIGNLALKTVDARQGIESHLLSRGLK